MDHGAEPDYHKYRTGVYQICRCKGQPYPYELEGPTAKTALDAVVLRAAFRKHNHTVRVGEPADNGSWDLPLSHEEALLEPPQPAKQDLTKRLPMEILHQILMDVYECSQTSNDICSCSRPGTPYGTVRARELKYRVVDTFAIRLTCGRWHRWALRWVLAGAVGGESLELDVSNLVGLNSMMRLPAGGLGKRLVEDFPFLDGGNRFSGVTLYVGNPGEVSNLVLVRELLLQERLRGGGNHRIFRGLSFWDLPRNVCEVVTRSRWNTNSMVLLDILSLFSTMSVPTRVQFPTIIFATISQDLWKPVLRGLLRHSDRLSLREFQSINQPAPRTRRRALQNLNPNHLQIPGGAVFVDTTPVPEDLEKHCQDLHALACLGPEKDWKQLRHLKLSLKDVPEGAAQDWRIDDSFLTKFTLCNLTRLVSVHIEGGLASILTIDALLRILAPSSQTLQKLTFTPTDGAPRPRAEEDGKHHCHLLSPLSMANTFPQLSELELHIPCCPDLFSTDTTRSWKPVKRRWRIRVPCAEGRFMGFCHDWIADARYRTVGFPLDPWQWDARSLLHLLDASRAARKRLFPREVGAVQDTQRKARGVEERVWEMLLGMQTDEEVLRELQKTAGGAEVAAAATCAEMWTLEIEMEDVNITGREGLHSVRALLTAIGYTDYGGRTDLVFRPLEVPPGVLVRSTVVVQGDRVARSRVVEKEVVEEAFLAAMGVNYVRCR